MGGQASGKGKKRNTVCRRYGQKGVSGKPTDNLGGIKTKVLKSNRTKESGQNNLLMGAAVKENRKRKMPPKVPL